jgi:DNA-binding MarR family transcriptional regulator
VSVATPERLDVGFARQALGVVFEGQLPPFEGRWRARIGEPARFGSVDELLAAGVDYFGPVARKPVRVGSGLGKQNVAETTNVVRLDLDPPPDIPLNEEILLIERAEKHLNGLEALGMVPSVFTFSGRGCWAYWKLDRHVSHADAEWLMRRLYAQFRREGSEWNIDRVARMPGSVNEKTGFRAFVMALNDVRWPPEALAELLPELDNEEAESSEPAGDLVFDAALSPSGRLPRLDLPDGLASYVEQCLPKKERKKLRIDGSAREQAIICRLVNAGYSDGQIAVYFDHHHLPRHEEEKRRRKGSYGWLARSIAKARLPLSASPVPVGSSDSSPGSSPSLVSIGNGTYFEEEDDSPTKSRQSGWEYRRWAILIEMEEGLPKLEVVGWVCSRFEIKRSQARRDLDWLQEKGYIEPLTDEVDKRVKRVYRTEEGRNRLQRQSEGRLRFLAGTTPVTFRKGLAGRSRSAAVEAEQDPDQSPPTPEPAVVVTQRPTYSRDWKEETAAENAELRRRERSLINDVFRIHIPGTGWTYFQPLIAVDEWVKVLFHEQLPVGLDEDGLMVYRSFVSPKDPSVGGEGAHDPIELRTLQNGGYSASDRWIGRAAELELVDGGFKAATRIEGGKQRPIIGLIVQAERNFYRPLIKSTYLHGGVIAVRKLGQKKDTRYEFARAGTAIEIPPDEFDFGSFLQHLADPTEMQAVVDSLPDGWYFSRRSTWARQYGR